MSDTGINLTALIDQERIENIRRYRAFDRICVTLETGQVGTGRTVGEALAKAKQDMTFAKYVRVA